MVREKQGLGQYVTGHLNTIVLTNCPVGNCLVPCPPHVLSPRVLYMYTPATIPQCQVTGPGSYKVHVPVYLCT